jgi:hypothetical protein
MRKLFLILAVLGMACVACTPTEITDDAKVTITSGDVVEIDAEGGKAEVTFVTEGGSGSRVAVKEDASRLDAKVESSKIVLTAKANSTASVREVVVVVSYDGAKTSFTVKQASSEYDVVFEANRLDGIYFGTEYSAAHNYYVILSDKGVNTDASVRPNTTYYYFDMYRNIAADEMNPIIPDGEYKYDAKNSYADKTFSESGSWYGKTGEDCKFVESASFKEATVTVKNGKFSAIITMEDDTTHYVSYEGKLVATTYISTFYEDVEFNVEGATITAECLGDTYGKGQQTWFIEAVKGNDYFTVEVMTPNANSCSGIYSALASSGVTDYSNKFIPGLLGDGLVGTWYAKLTDNVIKGEAMAPIVEGIIQIDIQGTRATINYSCKDDAGNNITGSVSGTM